MYYHIVTTLFLLMYTTHSMPMETNNKKSHYVRWLPIKGMKSEDNTVHTIGYFDLDATEPTSLAKFGELIEDAQCKHIPTIIARVEYNDDNKKMHRDYDADSLNQYIAEQVFSSQSRMIDPYRIPIQKIDYFIKKGISLHYFANHTDLNKPEISEILDPNIPWYKRILRLASITKDEKPYLKLALNHTNSKNEAQCINFHLAELYKDKKPAKALLYYQKAAALQNGIIFIKMKAEKAIQAISPRALIAPIPVDQKVKTVLTNTVRIVARHNALIASGTWLDNERTKNTHVGYLY